MPTHTNDNNPIITLSNYEEYLLLYVDNELTPQERGLVEAFLQFHPEPQAELDLLMGTKLHPEVLQFADKENLFAQNISAQNIDEDLLLYVDDELNEADKKKTEEKLNSDKTIQKQYQWLLRTKSDPAEVVPCPNKEELYRRTVRRIGSTFALRIAAAILLIASMGVLYLQQQNDGTAVVARIPEKSTKPAQAPKPNDEPKNNALAQAKEEGQKKEEQAATRPHANTAAVAALQPDRTGKKEKANELSKNPVQRGAMPAPENKVALAYEQAPVPQKNSADMQAIVPQKKELAVAVTSNTPLAYNTSEAPAEAAFAVNKEEDGRNRGNLKSLLCRATRLVERRTGISATNEDEELLIGVVALKLK